MLQKRADSGIAVIEEGMVGAISEGMELEAMQ